MINQMPSVGQSSVKRINRIVTSNFDVGNSSGTSNSVINGVHNVAVQDGCKVAIGSTIEWNSDVQETILG